MTLWNRSPRAVYQVYGEEEYLDGDDVRATQEQSSQPVSEPERGSRTAPLIGLGLLIGVCLAVLGLLLLNAVYSSPRSPHAANAPSARAGAANKASPGTAPSALTPAPAESDGSTSGVSAATTRRASAASDVPADTSSGPGASALASVGPVVHRHAEPVRHGVSRGRSGIENLPGMDTSPAAEPWRRRPFVPVLVSAANSAAGPPPTGDEFDFER
jgi:hypothetical protein